MVKQVLKTVYELDDVKEKAIEKNRYINVENVDWYDWEIDDWQNQLEKIGFTNSKIYFSGFCSQGDGACFDSDIDLNLILNNLDLTDDEKNKILKLKDDFDIKIEKNSYSNHYCHEKTRYINIDYFFIDIMNDKNLLLKLENLIENLRLNLCKQIYNDLENAYDDLTSDLEVYNTLYINDYYFESTGEIANV